MQEADAVQSLAALAQVLRLRLFRALVVAGPEGLTPGTLAEQLGVAGNTLSFHLKELTRAGLVTQERQGRNLVYRASFDTMDALLRYLTENCCEGAGCAAAEAVAPGRCVPDVPHVHGDR
ncbi:helix-turn-helix transcriptional regulator [Pseudorhodoferax sp. Leaf274]|uniref:ArsR/SmtB family transcription factor n=1 Tax=Pseudorhodoferax sp. Leaf274 TaxID=1736318 RepID=UPI000703BAA5|nr:metalloregulator ArsR/SmtB family transcription factor [Pseudorhodoferax sp. Leaf274]KQP35470.1 ArsR family transcriptional regulator [Pseudorhodoferax sp. Leaf274]